MTLPYNVDTVSISSASPWTVARTNYIVFHPSFYSGVTCPTSAMNKTVLNIDAHRPVALQRQADNSLKVEAITTVGFTNLMHSWVGRAIETQGFGTTTVNCQVYPVGKMNANVSRMASPWATSYLSADEGYAVPHKEKTTVYVANSPSLSGINNNGVIYGYTSGGPEKYTNLFNSTVYDSPQYRSVGSSRMTQIPGAKKAIIQQNRFRDGHTTNTGSYRTGSIHVTDDSAIILPLSGSTLITPGATITPGQFDAFSGIYGNGDATQFRIRSPNPSGSESIFYGILTEIDRTNNTMKVVQPCFSSVDAESRDIQITAPKKYWMYVKTGSETYRGGFFAPNIVDDRFLYFPIYHLAWNVDAYVTDPLSVDYGKPYAISHVWAAGFDSQIEHGYPNMVYDPPGLPAPFTDLRIMWGATGPVSAIKKTDIEDPPYPDYVRSNRVQNSTDRVFSLPSYSVAGYGVAFADQGTDMYGIHALQFKEFDTEAPYTAGKWIDARLPTRAEYLRKVRVIASTPLRGYIPTGTAEMFYQWCKYNIQDDQWYPWPGSNSWNHVIADVTSDSGTPQHKIRWDFEAVPPTGYTCGNGTVGRFALCIYQTGNLDSPGGSPPDMPLPNYFGGDASPYAFVFPGQQWFLDVFNWGTQFFVHPTDTDLKLPVWPFDIVKWNITTGDGHEDTTTGHVGWYNPCLPTAIPDISAYSKPTVTYNNNYHKIDVVNRFDWFQPSDSMVIDGWNGSQSNIFYRMQCRTYPGYSWAINAQTGLGSWRDDFIPINSLVQPTGPGAVASIVCTNPWPRDIVVDLEMWSQRYVPSNYAFCQLNTNPVDAASFRYTRTKKEYFTVTIPPFS